MTESRIWPMLMDDLDDIEEIERLSFSIPWPRQAFIQELSQNRLAHYFTVRDNGKAVAYGGMWFILDEAHITNLAVHPLYRRRGIGRTLLSEMINYGVSNGIKSFTLEVRESNDGALKLYNEMGFVKAGIRKGYYSDTKENAVIMWMKL